MIEFDESEHYNTVLEEDAMRILLSFLPRDVYDKLLYAGDRYVRLNHQPSRDAMEIRSHADSARDGPLCAHENEAIQEANEEVYAVFVRGRGA